MGKKSRKGDATAKAKKSSNEASIAEGVSASDDDDTLTYGTILHIVKACEDRGLTIEHYFEHRHRVSVCDYGEYISSQSLLSFVETLIEKSRWSVHDPEPIRSQ